MSHGEGDDFWDVFNAPQWFVEYLEHLQFFQIGDRPTAEIIVFVNREYRTLKELQDKWKNHAQ